MTLFLQMQDKLNHFMDNYEHMHSQVHEAQQDRDEVSRGSLLHDVISG